MPATLSARRSWTFISLLAPCMALAAPCTDAAREAGWNPPGVASTNEGGADFDGLLSRLSSRRVVFVGETHDRFDHHLNQLEIICRLRANGRPIAIGLELFQTPFQFALDDYVRLHGNLDRLLRESEYFRRWRYDARLYAPIFRFARRHRIPLVALNVRRELTRRVAGHGFAGLDEAAAAELPDPIAPASPDYRQRMLEVFRAHPGHEHRDFEHFLQAQLLWDEGMAEAAARYLRAEPERRLVVLAGSGHVAFSGTIPDRLASRMAVSRAVVTQPEAEAPMSSEVASEYRLITSALSLPPPGRLGVALDERDDRVTIQSFADDSAARDAGLEVGDRIVALDGNTIRDFVDVRLALWRKRAGDGVDLDVERDGSSSSMRLALH